MKLHTTLVASMLAIGVGYCAVPALADSSGSRLSVDDVQQSGSILHTHVSIRGADVSALTSESVTAVLGGRKVPVTIDSATGSATAPTAQTRRVLLLIDTSGSMLGAKIRAARQAADAFLAAVPADVEVGVASVAASTRILAAPTVNRPAVRQALSKLSPAGDTHLYDGVEVGLSSLGSSGNRLLVVLTDGADTGSHASLAAVIRDVAKSGTVVDAIGLQTTRAQASLLASIAAAGSGRLLQSSGGAALAGVFRATTHELVSGIQLSVNVPPGLGGRNVSLVVSVSLGSRRLSDSRVVMLSGTPPAGVVAVAPTSPAIKPMPAAASSTGLVIGLAAIFGALALVGIGLLAEGTYGGRRGGRRARRLLKRYTVGAPSIAASPEVESSVLGGTGLMRSALALTQRLVAKRGSEEKVALLLDRAGVRLRPNEWLVIRAIAVMIAFALLALLGHSLWIGILIGAPIGFLLPRAWLNWKARKRSRAFVDRLPDSLQLVAGSLGAGYSLLQAFDGLVQEGEEPIASEVGRALAGARLGVPIEDALDQLAERMDSPDFAWTSMAIRIQREVGGNLNEVLTTVAETLRERAALRRQVRALSAEGRLSAYILIAIPSLMALYEVTFRRQYASPLWTTRIGLVLVVTMVVQMVFGTIWMRKLVNVEV